MSVTLPFVCVWLVVGSVAYALVQSGHWVAGLLLTVILLLGSKVGK